MFVIAVAKQPKLGENACIIRGTGDKRHHVNLRAIHDAVVADITHCLPEFHVFTGSDSAGKFATMEKKHAGIHL